MTDIYAEPELTLRERIVGSVVIAAAADALGAQFETKPPLHPDTVIEPRDSNWWRAGEWTDDTAMSYPILHTATVEPLWGLIAFDKIAAGWLDWAKKPKGSGGQTRAVLLNEDVQSYVRDGHFGLAEELAKAAALAHERTGKSGGNGSLMRTGAVAVGTLHLDDGSVARIAEIIGLMTHPDPDAVEACIIWTFVVRRALQEETLRITDGLQYLAAERRALWEERIMQAETIPPAFYGNNYWSVETLQSAWHCVTHFAGKDAILEAIRGGRDTDTVATVVGSVVGALYGEETFPSAWRTPLFGYPDGVGDGGLRALANQIADRAVSDERSGERQSAEGGH